MLKLIKDKRMQDAATPALLHPDFHKRNIYVSAQDPTVMTGVLDWQSASIEPAFIYANETPDFAALPEETEGNIFEDGQDEQKVPGQKEREWKDALICYQTYDVCMKGLAPKLRLARLLDPILFRIFQYFHTTWRDSATALRQELIELSARWTELGLQGSCPFSPTEEELKKHARDYEDFETVQKLKLWLRNSLHTNSDGWVPNDVWNAAKDAHRAVYDEWIQTARESESSGEGLTVAKQTSCGRLMLDNSESQARRNFTWRRGLVAELIKYCRRNTCPPGHVKDIVVPTDGGDLGVTSQGTTTPPSGTHVGSGRGSAAI
ncbi:hypothetical protein Asppvi_005598 [Aspergillus pseudoviridinutans]|uniref:Altered inheritance of mitochondria protein 9, mitochondrial n=1 Tax=Aspergillus pseudoviridinutans TaxID=1517512 RepID=A0A9P3B9L2_9EURO|nr:uncharacterized protein Asppvi_005598 [Aspergillus pseudoviridinutans]GIJ86705.1 hypothetical protein Asppvi_005598 [Aspergillus pseudoviridinutans]